MSGETSREDEHEQEKEEQGKGEEQRNKEEQGKEVEKGQEEEQRKKKEQDMKVANNGERIRKRLGGSIYLWACGETEDLGTDGLKLPDIMIGWLILVVRRPRDEVFFVSPFYDKDDLRLPDELRTVFGCLFAHGTQIRRRVEGFFWMSKNDKRSSNMTARIDLPEVLNKRMMPRQYNMYGARVLVVFVHDNRLHYLNYVLPLSVAISALEGRPCGHFCV